MGLMEGARVTVGSCLNVKKKDSVLVICDHDTQRIGSTIYEAALELTDKALLVLVPPERLQDGEPPPMVVAAMKKATVIIAPTTSSITHSRAIQLAANRGSRVASMPGITARMMRRGGMTADFRSIRRIINRVHRHVRRPKMAHLTNELGTDLTLDLRGRRWITQDTGICHKPKQVTNLPAGEIFIAPVEKSAQGRLVVDGSFHGLVDKPVDITIRDGYAIKITNALQVYREMEAGGKETFNVAELGLGMNPDAKLIGNVLEDGKALGTVHIGFGDNSTFGGTVSAPFNRDAVMAKPTLTINDKLIIEDGELKV